MSAKILDTRIVFYTQPSHGLGEEARRARSLDLEFRGEFLNSVSLEKPKQDALDSLYVVFVECSPGDWDGYSAAPSSYESYVKAKQFIEALPTNLPVPEIAMDPDGEVSFEWYRSPRRVFSVSVGPNDELTYAGVFGASKTHGTETFHGEIPRIILENVRRVFA